MIKSMMSAVSGLQAHQTMMDVIANNIANVNTVGFRASRATFKDLFYQTLNQGSESTNPWQVGFGTQIGSVDKLMTRMGAIQTDAPLDLYIDGEGFFAVNSAQDGSGAAYFTRTGNFHIDSQGYMVDSNGNYLLSYSDAETPGEPICILGTTLGSETIDETNYNQLSGITINQDGTISATLNGQVGRLNDGELKIALANFVNPDGLLEVGNSNFVAGTSSGTASYLAAGDGNSIVIRSGELEMSNVDLARELTNMIVTQRGYQANSRVISTSDELVQDLLNLKR